MELFVWRAQWKEMPTLGTVTLAHLPVTGLALLSYFSRGHQNIKEESQPTSSYILTKVDNRGLRGN